MRRLLFSAFILMLVMGGCALNKDVIYLDNRIDSLEGRLLKDNKKGVSSSTAIRKRYATLNNKYETMTEQVLRLTGQVEELQHTLSQMSSLESSLKSELKILNTLLSQQGNRIDGLEAYVGYHQKNATGKSDKPSKSGKKDGKITPEELYSAAKTAYDNGKMGIAKKQFQKFIKNYPKSSNADNAQFWLGEIFYREKWFQKAILEYQKVIENYPKGNKVPAAYLKQGLAFKELGENDNAQLILSELVKKYPKTKEAKLGKKHLK